MQDSSSPTTSNAAPSPAQKICDALTQPVSETCAHVMDRLGSLSTQSPHWQLHLAPGHTNTPASDTCLISNQFYHWKKLTVPFPLESMPIKPGETFTNTLRGWLDFNAPVTQGQPEISADVSLPDIWPPDRNYHHAWYALSVELDPEDAPTHWLQFDAIAQHAVVFINNQHAHTHLGGSTPFEIDITRLIKKGANTITLLVQDDTAVIDPDTRRACCSLDEGRGNHNAHHAGVRGGVYLLQRQTLHVHHTRIKTSIRTKTLAVETWLRGQSQPCDIHYAVYRWPQQDGDQPVLAFDADTSGDKHPSHDTPVATQIPWQDAELWSPDHPNLYVLRTMIRMHGETASSETIETRFGFREFWIQGRQFILNNKPVRLLGDADRRRELLTVIPDKALAYGREVLRFIKQHFNFNSIRLHTSIFPKWATLAADEAGLLVVNQAGFTSGSKRSFADDASDVLRHTKAQFQAWYWRDVNSPSVVIWDVENEMLRAKSDAVNQANVHKLDQFIKDLDPDAIVQHSGAAWNDPNRQLIHVHMQEHYSRVIRSWLDGEEMPLVLGEFWIGGRGETRLPNAMEYSTRDQWHAEESRLYREHMLEMRYHGVSGVMPHRITHWPLLKHGALTTPDDPTQPIPSPYDWRFTPRLTQGARGLAPIIAFIWPRSASIQASQSFTREVVVCNDSENTVTLNVICKFGNVRKHWPLTLEPGQQQRTPVTFRGPCAEAPLTPTRDLSVTVTDSNGQVIETDLCKIHPLTPPAVDPPSLKRRVVVVPYADESTASALESLNIAYETSATLPSSAHDAASTLVIVPSHLQSDALGRDARNVANYLDGDGRMLVLAQDAAPDWLPVDLPFWSASRTSVPEFNHAGWEPNNKDLIFSCELPVYAHRHPVLKNLREVDFKNWAAGDGRISDDAFIRPNAVGRRVQGAYRVLLGATRRENASLVELKNGPRGCMLLCQAQLLENRHQPAARALFYSQLRYLDGEAWQSPHTAVGITGDVTAKTLCNLTGLDVNAVVDVTRLPPDTPAPSLVIAAAGADVDLLLRLAHAGSTVLVLSCEVTRRLPGYAVTQSSDGYYSATRDDIHDHPLFWGVNGASFLPLEQSPAQGEITQRPDRAFALLNGHKAGHSPLGNDWTADIGFYGLETRLPAGPIAVGQRTDEGLLIATTLEPWNINAESHRQLLTAILANAGIALPAQHQQSSSIPVKHTVPLDFDGLLHDWTNDLDDINLSLHSHAAPIAITSKDAAAGHPASDLHASAILYLLHDEQHLYLGGIVFAKDKNAPITINAHFENAVVEIDLTSDKVLLNSQPFSPQLFATGTQPASEIVDMRLLNLTTVHAQTNKHEVASNTRGRTFELAIPWHAFDHNQTPNNLKAQFKINVGANITLQRPAGASEENQQWLDLQLQSQSHNPGVS